jgi:hypothetical protein
MARLLLLSFGGGTCIPIALGFRPFPLANDAAITLLLIAWWLMHCFPGDAIYKLFNQVMPLRAVLVCGFEVARCNVIITWLTRAHEVGPYQSPFVIVLIEHSATHSTFTSHTSLSKVFL